MSERRPAPAPAPAPSPAPGPPAPDAAPPPALTGRRIAVLSGCWLLVLLLGLGLAATALGGLAESRAQRSDLRALRQSLTYAEAASRSVLGAEEVVGVPAQGSPVALLQVPRLGLQRVVLEGAAPGQTQHGPGHVPGTAGPGQPGNSAVVGRRSAYGGAFARLGELHPGDPLLVTTAQGQSVYRVTRVRSTPADVLAPSADSRLTLVTTAGRGPTGWSRSLVVSAVLDGTPFPATRQGVRTALSDGGGDGSAWPLVVIWAALLAATAVAAALLYRRWLVRSTYLVTTPALVALVVLLTDAVTRLLPASV